MTAEDRETLDRLGRLDSLNQVVGGFAHDFSNLLTTITLNLNLLEKKCSDPTALWFARSALRVADRGADLVNRLLAFAGKQTLSRVPADLNLLLSGMRDLLSRTVGPSVDLVVLGAGGLWPASVDRDQLEFALLNVAENARAAMPRGGRLAIEMANARIATPLGDVAPGDYVVIALEDTGEGLSEEAAERAFEPFFSTRRSPEHPGLGLSVVLGIAKAHGGSARVVRAAGGGCRIELYLPRATEAEMHGSPDPDGESDAATQPASTTVLVVDDDPDLLAVAQDGLTSLGYDVRLADSGSAALEVLASHGPIDLLMVDMTMAGMSGLELIRRARETRPGLKALVMTGGPAATAGCDGSSTAAMLAKPFRAADLAQAVAAVMSGGAVQ
jgi:CheY-like chemotaxis protein